VEYTDSDFKKLAKRYKVPLFGTDEWYIQDIVDSYMKDGKPVGYKHTIDDFGPYSLRIFYCSAEADYDLLGQHNDTIDAENYHQKSSTSLTGTFWTGKSLTHCPSSSTTG